MEGAHTGVYYYGHPKVEVFNKAGVLILGTSMNWHESVPPQKGKYLAQKLAFFFRRSVFKGT